MALTATDTATTPTYSSMTTGEQKALSGTVATNVTNPTVPESATQTYTNLASGADYLQSTAPTSESFMDKTTGATAYTGTTKDATAWIADASTYTASTIDTAPTATAATSGVSYEIDPATGQLTNPAEAAQATIDQEMDLMKAAQGTLSTGATAEAQTAALEQEATVRKQMTDLLQDLEGGNIPTWAQPAYAQVEAALAARGMSTSTIGRDALFNAITQAAMPIAQQDAQAYAQRGAQNLSNRQQTALQNAQAIVGIDMANLNNRQQAAVMNSQFIQTVKLQNLSNQQQAAIQNAVNWAAMDQQNLTNVQQAQVENARNFLQMDLSNLSNEQQTAIFNTQSQLQTLLSDQSAQNAAKQFNAQSQTQVDSLMAQLATNVSLQNAAQYNAMGQFNATTKTQVSQYNAQMDFNREQFNSQMYAQLEQSNVNWRRQMNTIDTAGLNAVNQANAINAFNLSNQALTWLWGDMRDSASWAFQAAENDQEYDLRMALAALSNEQATDKLSLDTWKAVGSFISAVF